MLSADINLLRTNALTSKSNLTGIKKDEGDKASNQRLYGFKAKSIFVISI
jgi:hypothetical protein